MLSTVYVVASESSETKIMNKNAAKKNKNALTNLI
jgi:hypothetical protein